MTIARITAAARAVIVSSLIGAGAVGFAAAASATPFTTARGAITRTPLWRLAVPLSRSL